MTTTQETQVADTVNQIIAIASTLYGVGQQINRISAQWTNLGAATKINAFPTAVLTTTGGIGAADTTPSTTNPINTTVAPGTEINRAISATDIAGLLTYLQGIASAIGGAAISANGAAAQLVAKTL
jgi:hypothetical protein